MPCLAIAIPELMLRNVAVYASLALLISSSSGSFLAIPARSAASASMIFSAFCVQAKNPLLWDRSQILAPKNIFCVMHSILGWALTAKWQP
jgi:hypothetical protein